MKEINILRAIIWTLFIAVGLTAYILSTGNYNNEVAIGKKIYNACELAKSGSIPDVQPVKLPNGNLGYYITCE